MSLRGLSGATRRKTLAGLASALAAGAAGLRTARAATSWRMTTEYPASAISGEGIATFGRLLAERSGGRLAVEPVFDAKSGVTSADTIAAIRDGRIEAGDAFGGGLGTRYPLFGLSSLPFVAASIADARRLADLARPAYGRLLAAERAHLLFATPWPPTGLWSKDPVSGLADLRALSVRTYDDVSTRVLEAAGARARNITFSEAMPKLRAGEINAVLSSGDGGAGRRLWDLLPHFTEITYALPLSFALVGEATYGALDPDLRAAVDATAADTEARQWSAIRTRLDENYARMRANGVTIATAPSPEMMAALRSASAGAIEAWRGSAGPEGAAALDAFLRG